MRVAKRYIAKVEKTIYVIETIHIVAESEEDAMEILRANTGQLAGTKIQEEVLDQRWIECSEPLTEDELEIFIEDGKLPIG